MVATIDSLYGFGDNFVFPKHYVLFYIVLGIYQLYLMNDLILFSCFYHGLWQFFFVWIYVVVC